MRVDCDKKTTIHVTVRELLHALGIDLVKGPGQTVTFANSISNPEFEQLLTTLDQEIHIKFREVVPRRKTDG